MIFDVFVVVVWEFHFFFFFGSEVVLRFIYLFIHSFISSDGSSLRQASFF